MHAILNCEQNVMSNLKKKKRGETIIYKSGGIQMLSEEEKKITCGWSRGMSNLGAGLRADGLPAGQAERPEDSPRWVLPAGQRRESKALCHRRVTAWLQHSSGGEPLHYTSTPNQHWVLLTTYEMMSLQSGYLHILYTPIRSLKSTPHTHKTNPNFLARAYPPKHHVLLSPITQKDQSSLPTNSQTQNTIITHTRD